MTNRLVFIFVLISLLCVSCLGIVPNEVSDEFTYRSEVALPVGHAIVHYESVDSLPVAVPSDGSVFSFDEEQNYYFDLSQTIKKEEYIEKLTIHFYCVSAFPASAQIQLFYINSGGMKVDLTQGKPIILPAALINAQGLVTQNVVKIVDIELSQDDITELLLVKEVSCVTQINDLLLSPEVIENFASYYIDIAVGLKVNFVINTNEK